MFWNAFQDTHIIVVLETMADEDWGHHTTCIQELALTIKDELQGPQSLDEE